MNGEDDYEEYLDEAQDQYDTQEDMQDEQLDSYGTYPTPKPNSDMYTWFWRVVELNDPPEKKAVVVPFKLSKVGNLNTTEIGQSTVSVRDAMNLAYLGQLFHHPTFGSYWAARARITSASSMAKNGWFMDLSISQRRIRERQRSGSGESQKKKWRLFGKKKSEEQ
jgi:hypothetical protein